VANALAAIALAHHAGAEPERLAEALLTFSGVDRRLSWRGEGGGSYLKGLGLRVGT
jgi:UDP-N-acetylmuramate-alanine ligase